MGNTRRFAQCAAVAAVAILFGASAEAGFVRGGFDPEGDGTVPGYSGNVVFNVDDSCFQSGFTGYEKVATDCGPVTVVSGQVNLFDLTGPITGSPLDSFTLGPGDLNVIGLRFVDGAVQGIDTDIGGIFSGSSVYSGYQLFLQFVTGCLNPSSNGGDPYANCGDPPVGPIFLQLLAATPIEQNLQQALLFVDTDSCGGDCLSDPLPTGLGHLQFAPVPEPGTIGLMLAALGSGWLGRRRRKQTAV